MTLRFIASVLSITILAHIFNAGQGSPSTPLEKTGNVYDSLINDIVNKAQDHKKKAVENFSKRIEKYKDDFEKHKVFIQKKQDSNPEEDTPGVRGILTIQEHIKKAHKNHAKNYTDVVTALLSALTGNEDESANDSTEAIQQDLYSERDKDHAGDNKCQESEEYESNSKDKSDESSNSKERKHYRTVHSVMHDIIGRMRDLTSRTVDRVMNNEHFFKSQLRTKFDMLIEALAKDNDSGESYDEDYGDSWKNNSAEATSEDVNEINKFIKGELNRIKEEHNETKANVHSAIVKKIWEILGSDINSLLSSKQAFIASKAEVVNVANKLHEASRMDYGHPRGSSESKTFDFQSLISLKSKIGKMILEKKQYINQKVLLKRKFKEVLKNAFLTYPKTTVNSFTSSSKELKKTFADLFTIIPGFLEKTKFDSNVSSTNFNRNNGLKLIANNMSNNKTDDDGDNSLNIGQTTEQIDISFNISINTTHGDELKLAAGYLITSDLDDDRHSSIAVVVVLLACLVISAIIGVLSVVMWKKYHSHRLYVRIPNRSSTAPSERRSIW